MPDRQHSGTCPGVTRSACRGRPDFGSSRYNGNRISAPRNIYDSWVLSMIIPLVKTAEDNLDLFALKHNNGWRKANGAKTDLLRIEFDIPDENMAEVLDWSASNATRLFDIGYKSGLRLSEANADKLTFAPVPA